MSIRIVVEHQDLGRIVSGGVLLRDNYSDSVPRHLTFPAYAVAVICGYDSSRRATMAVAVGSFRRSRRVTSFARRYEIAEISLLREPVDLSLVVELMPSRFRQHTLAALESTTALPEGTSDAFVVALRELARDASELIEIAAGFPSRLAEMTPARSRLLAEEKDSMAVTATIAGLGRSVGDPGRRLVVPEDPVDPSRTYLDTVHFGLMDNDEDAILNEEMRRFDGIFGKSVRRNARGVRIRLRGGGHLLVLNTNRTDLEHTEGCDLIYYRPDRHCGLMVQYKRMKHDGNGVWTYRGDAGLRDQLARMRRLRIDRDPSEVGQYRLNPQAHYLKVVRPKDYDGRSARLMGGLYLPLDLVDLMLDSPEDTTTGGNLIVKWAGDGPPPQRHLNNTRFTDLLREGWIGSCGVTSDEIRGWLEPRFEANDLITIAIEDRTTRRNP